jgi:hypothetical protein
MATAVAIMDRSSFEGNTDVLAVVDPALPLVLSVPRDLWCESIGDRVNSAYARGGHAALAAALAEHGIAADHSLCLLPAAIESGFDDLEIEVPVESFLAYWHPGRLWNPLDKGWRLVVFEPPSVVLSGQWLHAWIGARFALVGLSSDLARVERQQVLLRALLRDGADFGRFLSPADAVESSSQAAIDELREVGPDWAIATLPDLRPTRIDGKDVLRRG